MMNQDDSWWWIKIDSRCFDDNKDDDKKPKRMISRLSEQFKIQEKVSSRSSRFKNNQDQDSKLKDSRIKRRLNQDKY